MRGRIDVLRTVAVHEARTVLRGRMVPTVGALFALLTAAIALGGLGGSGQLLVQGFTRTAVSVLNLSLYLLPLLGLLLGAAAFSGVAAGTELLLAQPIGRVEALLGRVLGLAAIYAVIPAAGFVLPGLLVAARAGTAGLGGYVLVAAGASAVGLVGLGIGVLIGIAARRRTAAVGWALAAWFAAVVLYDLAAIAVLQVAGSGEPGPWLVALLAFNPVDGIRTLGLVGLGADVLLGPTGAALQKLFGNATGAGIVLAGLGAWLLVPVVAAGAVFARRDF